MKPLASFALAGLAALMILTAAAAAGFAGDAPRESVFDRVMRTGTIRCGYVVFPPMAVQNPQTGKLEGMMVDLMNEIGERAGLKIEWAEEVTFGNWAPALQADRFDAVCTPMWPEIPMARSVAFTEPMFYAGLSPLVRADDARFKGEDLARLDQPDVTFITQDGNALDPLTRAAFPKARVKTLAANVEGPVTLQEIITGKADAILLDRNAEIAYNRNNPVKLRLVAPDRPVKVQPFTFVVRRDEMIWKDYLDNALRELRNDGTVERLLRKWEPEPGTFLRDARPYAEPEKQ